MKKFLSLLMALLLVVTLLPMQANAATKISKAKATLEVDATLQLKLGDTATSKATWTSSKKAVATVSKTGVVTAKAEGKITITATVNKKKYTCTVTVVNSNKAAAPTPTTKPTTSTVGTRTNPYDAFKETKITISNYSYGDQTVNLKLLDIKDGEEANSIIAAENMFNEVPNTKNRWVLYHFSLEYVKGKGELYASDLVNSSSFYNADSTKSLSLETASFANELSGFETYSVSLYEGGKNDFYIAVLLDNSIKYTTLKVNCGYDKNYNTIEKWLTTKE